MLDANRNLPSKTTEKEPFDAVTCQSILVAVIAVARPYSGFDTLSYLRATVDPPLHAQVCSRHLSPSLKSGWCTIRAACVCELSVCVLGCGKCTTARAWQRMT